MTSMTSFPAGMTSMTSFPAGRRNEVADMSSLSKRQSGKRQHGMVPRASLDVPMVSPSAKRSCDARRNALVKPSTPVERKKSLHLTTFLCAPCGGNHWWGHGNGCMDSTIWRCDNPKCKRSVPKVTAEEAQARASKCPHCLGEKMWNESPTAFASKKEAIANAMEILEDDI